MVSPTGFAPAFITDRAVYHLSNKGDRMRKAFFTLALVAMTSAAFAHEGTWFMPQIPDPDAMVIDGNDDDWGWMDPGFFITPDNFLFPHFEGVWPPPKDDWDILLKVAWSSQPDNRLYYFARVTDDSLGTFTPNAQEYWRDDALEIITDADHSSENFYDTEMQSGQQYFHHILPAAGQPQVYLGGGEPEWQWSRNEPVYIAAWTVDPPGAQPGQQPAGSTVTYTYEAAKFIYDFHDKGGHEGSIVHNFVPEEVIGLTFFFDEAENAEVGREQQAGTSPIEAAFNDNSLGTDFIPLLTEGATGGTGITAVEAQSWGRIKSFVSDR